MGFLFSNSNEIKIPNKINGSEVVILKNDIKRMYSGMNLKKCVIKKVIKAHETVLRYGINTGNERVIAIDSETGRIEVDETGTPDNVIWYWDPTHNRKLITIHNHPNSSVFSHIDLYTFGINEQTQCMGVQGHNGRTYTLRKTAGVPFTFTKDLLFLILVGIMTANVDKSDIEQGEMFVKTVAKTMKWEFLKGVE